MDCSENIFLFREIGFWGTIWDYGRLVGVNFRVYDGREEGGTKVEAVEGCWIGISAIDSECEGDEILIMLLVHSLLLV